MEHNIQLIANKSIFNVKIEKINFSNIYFIFLEQFSQRSKIVVILKRCFISTIANNFILKILSILYMYY